MSRASSTISWMGPVGGGRTVPIYNAALFGRHCIWLCVRAARVGHRRASCHHEFPRVISVCLREAHHRPRLTALAYPHSLSFKFIL